MLWIKLAFALEGLIVSYLQAPRENGVWIYDTFGNNFGIKTDSDPHFLFRYAINTSFHLEDFPQNVVWVCDTFGNNLRIKSDLIKYFKKSCLECSSSSML